MMIVASMAIGIGATTTLFSVLYAILLRPLDLSEADRLTYPIRVRRSPRSRHMRAAALQWSRVARRRNCRLRPYSAGWIVCERERATQESCQRRC